MVVVDRMTTLRPPPLMTQRPASFEHESSSLIVEEMPPEHSPQHCLMVHVLHEHAIRLRIRVRSDTY